MELIFVVSITAVITGISVLQLASAQPWLKGDGAMRVVLGQMRMARELAITQRRYIRLTFVDPNTIQLIREEVPGPDDDHHRQPRRSKAASSIRSCQAFQTRPTRSETIRLCRSAW